MSRPPKARSVSSIAWWQSSALRTSERMKTALPPSFTILSATACPRFSSRPVIVTLAPSLAKSAAVASPMPDVPPVIKATLFSNRIFFNPTPPDLRRRQPVPLRSQKMLHHWQDTVLRGRFLPACRRDPEDAWPNRREIDLRSLPFAVLHFAALRYRCHPGRCSLRESSAGRGQWP